MQDIIYTVANYLMIFLMLVYSLRCFAVFKYKNKTRQNRIFVSQNIIMFIVHFIGCALLFIKDPNENLLIYYGLQFILLLFIILMYNAVYPESSRLIINNMCMLIVIGCIMIARINYNFAFRQFIFIASGIIISIFIPKIIEKFRFLRDGWIVYAFLGTVILLSMRFFQKTYGAHISISLFGISFQPQEFVKIIFIFMVASMLKKSIKFKQILLSAILSGTFVLILVWANDLGIALIFALVYIIMVYVATNKKIYFLSGVAFASCAFVLGYNLFSHVRARVSIWLDPWSRYLNEGYQLVMGMFAMANGSWFGVGLGNGNGINIPIVYSDLIIIPIIEELGLVFALCILLICLSNFIMFLNISSIINDSFYRLVAIGFGAAYIVQVILTVGGSTKFIPMTGVTLPLVSYGGSSILATIIIFSIIQGIYVIYGEKKTVNTINSKNKDRKDKTNLGKKNEKKSKE